MKLHVVIVVAHALYLWGTGFSLSHLILLSSSSGATSTHLSPPYELQPSTPDAVIGAEGV